MSGEGPSKAAKRKRDPPRKPIQYSEPEKHNTVDIKTLREHTLLKFASGTREAEKCDALCDVPLLVARTIDWDLLDIVGQRDRIEKLLGPRFKKVLACEKPQYEQLTIEFHSTYIHRDGGFYESDAVSFSLGRVLHQMSIPQFAVVTGYYTAEEVQTPEFLTSLRGVSKEERECCISEKDLEDFWHSIANVPYSGGLAGSAIRDPVYRYIHKVLGFTLVGRKSSENRVNWVELFCLYCMVKGREANLASVIAWSFSRPRRGGPRAALDMGPYITQIAENLNVMRTLGPYTEHRLVKGPPKPMCYGLKDLRNAGILTCTEPPEWVAIAPGPQVLPPEGTAAAATLQASIPTRLQRPRQRYELIGRQYPLRELPPVPLTLEALAERTDRQIRELRELITEGHRVQAESQRRQEDALRSIMGALNLGTPEFFRAPEQHDPQVD